MNLDEKIEQSWAFILELVRQYNRPILNCSFGKDSMVLLHLLLSRQVKMPVVYYSDPWFPRKNDFAHRVSSMWNLEVHTYPPAKVSLLYGKEIVALASEYQTSPHSVVSVLKNALEYKDGDERFLCGLNFLMRPCAVFVFPWDLSLVAHKDVDEDQIYGIVPLHSQIVYRDEGPDYAFPLKEWTHDDIWDYTEAHKVPVQADRYDIANRCEWDDKTFNSDWYEVCLRCVDKRLQGQKVWCPKLERELVNVSDAAPEFGHVPDYFGTKNKG